jgi:hypothetical protein
VRCQGENRERGGPGTKPKAVTIIPTRMTEVYSRESRALLEAIVESFKRSNARWSMITPAKSDETGAENEAQKGGREEGKMERPIIRGTRLIICGPTKNRIPVSAAITN